MNRKFSNTVVVRYFKNFYSSVYWMGSFACEDTPANKFPYFACVYGIRFSQFFYWDIFTDDLSTLSENQGNFTCAYVNQTYGCEYKILPISDRKVDSDPVHT
jgi:hypothetical protein